MPTNANQQHENQPVSELEPPADLAADSVTEWYRVIAAVAHTGRTLKTADQPLLTLYVSTWKINRQAYQHVAQYGAIIKWPNGLPGASPQYKSFIETSKQLRGLLADLGCTPASRDFDIAPTTIAPTEPAPLDY
jgi:P27 family predicted phage terminase small subunit